MLPHPLTKFEIQKYHQNESNLNGFYFILLNDLSKRKDGSCIINFDEYE